MDQPYDNSFKTTTENSQAPGKASLQQLQKTHTTALNLAPRQRKNGHWKDEKLSQEERLLLDFFDKISENNIGECLKNAERFCNQMDLVLEKLADKNTHEWLMNSGLAGVFLEGTFAAFRRFSKFLPPRKLKRIALRSQALEPQIQAQLSSSGLTARQRITLQQLENQLLELRKQINYEMSPSDLIANLQTKTSRSNETPEIISDRSCILSPDEIEHASPE